MKKGYVCILCTVILVFAVTVTVPYCKKYILYEKYRYPNEEFYGKELYSEIGYHCSDYEKDVGNTLLDKAIMVSEYRGSEKDAESELGEVGALSRYYYYNTKGTSEQKAELQFITCKISGESGHIWLNSTVLNYDENGKCFSGGRDMLTLWYIEKNGEEWFVEQVIETP